MKTFCHLLFYDCMKKYAYIRPVLGFICLILGIVFSFIPLIPVLGILGIFAGAFLLAPYIPVFHKMKEWLKSKDKSGKTQEAEEKLEGMEQKNKEKQKEKERH